MRPIEWLGVALLGGLALAVLLVPEPAQAALVPTPRPPPPQPPQPPQPAPLPPQPPAPPAPVSRESQFGTWIAELVPGIGYNPLLGGGGDPDVGLTAEVARLGIRELGRRRIDPGGDSMLYHWLLSFEGVGSRARDIRGFSLRNLRQPLATETV